MLKHLLNRANRINILFYLIAGMFIWYLYSFKVLGALFLTVLSVFALTSFLLTIYTWVRVGFKGIDNDFLYSTLLVIIVFPLVFFTLDKQLLGYILALSTIGMGIGIYRSY